MFTRVSGFIDFNIYNDISDLTSEFLGTMGQSDNHNHMPKGSEGSFHYTVTPLIEVIPDLTTRIERYRVSFFGALRDFDEFDFKEINKWLQEMPNKFAGYYEDNYPNRYEEHFVEEGMTNKKLFSDYLMDAVIEATTETQDRKNILRRMWVWNEETLDWDVK